MINFIK